MTEVSRFWTGTALGDAGPYSADQFARELRRVIGPGAGAAGAANSGVLWGSGANPDVGLEVIPNSPAAQSIILKPGAALVHGVYYENDANLVLSVPANGSGNPRIDSVILRKDWSTQTVRAVVKSGTPAGSPVAPGLTQSNGSIWEIPLADLTLANGYTTITASEILSFNTYQNVAPQIVIDNVQNGSGVTLNTGDVVVWASAANRQVTTSTTLGARVAGVWQGRTANGGYGRLLIKGVGVVRCNGAVTRYAPLVHYQNQLAKMPAAGESYFNSFALALDTTAGSAYVYAHIDCTIPAPLANVEATHNTPSDITSNTTTFADIDGSNIKITIVTNTGRVRVRFVVPFYFNYSVGTAWGHFNIRANGATDATADANGLNTISTAAWGGAGSSSSEANSVTVEAVFSGLTPGSNYFTLRWRAELGTATAPVLGIRQYNATGGHRVYMSAIELAA